MGVGDGVRRIISRRMAISIFPRFYNKPVANLLNATAFSKGSYKFILCSFWKRYIKFTQYGGWSLISKTKNRILIKFDAGKVILKLSNKCYFDLSISQVYFCTYFSILCWISYIAHCLYLLLHVHLCYLYHIGLLCFSITVFQVIMF
jgi:hypothetical protein